MGYGSSDVHYRRERKELTFPFGDSERDPIVNKWRSFCSAMTSVSTTFSCVAKECTISGAKFGVVLF